MIFLVIITINLDYFLLLLFIILAELFNTVLKENVFKPLMSNKKHPIIGWGTRPPGAKNCGPFLSSRGDIFSKSYGMPSGHAQNAVIFATYFILDILYGNKGTALIQKMISIAALVAVTLSVLYSRIRFGCHTLQQVIVGSLFGFALSYTFYMNKDVIAKAAKNII